MTAKLNTFRKPTRRYLVGLGLLSVFISVVAAMASFPSRQVASRTHTDAYIPFRAITVQEASRLYRSTFNGSRLLDVIAYDDESVLVSTSRYVLPEGMKSGEAFDGVPSASWEGYKTVHEVPRKAFEESVGANVSQMKLAEIDWEKVSFDSRRLVYYVAFEVSFLAFSIFLLGLALYVVRSKWWWLPIYLVWAAGYGGVVLIYSPAFFDADLFYQRLMVEIPVPYLLAPFWLFPVAVLIVAGGLMFWLVRWLQRNASIGPKGRLYSRRLAFISPFLVVISISVAMNYFKMSGLKACLLEINSNLDKELIQGLAEFSGDDRLPEGEVDKCHLLVCKELEGRLQSFRTVIRSSAMSNACGSGTVAITFFMPLTQDRWVYAFVGPGKSYLDIRNPENTMGFESVESVLSDAEEQPLARLGFRLLDTLSFGGVPTAWTAVGLEADDGKKFAALVGRSD